MLAERPLLDLPDEAHRREVHPPAVLVLENLLVVHGRHRAEPPVQHAAVWRAEAQRGVRQLLVQEPKSISSINARQEVL